MKKKRTFIFDNQVRTAFCAETAIHRDFDERSKRKEIRIDFLTHRECPCELNMIRSIQFCVIIAGKTIPLMRQLLVGSSGRPLY